MQRNMLRNTWKCPFSFKYDVILYQAEVSLNSVFFCIYWEDIENWALSTVMHIYTHKPGLIFLYTPFKEFKKDNIQIL